MNPEKLTPWQRMGDLMLIRVRQVAQQIEQRVRQVLPEQQSKSIAEPADKDSRQPPENATTPASTEYGTSSA